MQRGSVTALSTKINLMRETVKVVKRPVRITPLQEPHLLVEQFNKNLHNVASYFPSGPLYAHFRRYLVKCPTDRCKPIEYGRLRRIG